MAETKIEEKPIHAAVPVATAEETEKLNAESLILGELTPLRLKNVVDFDDKNELSRAKWIEHFSGINPPFLLEMLYILLQHILYYSSIRTQ